MIFCSKAIDEAHFISGNRSCPGARVDAGDVEDVVVIASKFR